MSETAAHSSSAEHQLDPGLGNVLFDTWLVSRSVHDLIDTAIESTGLDADEFAVYSVLASGDGMTPSELAHWMSAPTTTVSSYIKRFERRGHITRTPNAEDRRSYRLELTTAGLDAHRDAGELFTPLLRRIEEVLGVQAPAVRTQLLALRNAIDTLQHERPETRSD